jgi:hypothetical protein
MNCRNCGYFYLLRQLRSRCNVLPPAIDTDSFQKMTSDAGNQKSHWGDSD